MNSTEIKNYEEMELVQFPSSKKAPVKKPSKQKLNDDVFIKQLHLIMDYFMFEVFKEQYPGKEVPEDLEDWFNENGDSGVASIDHKIALHRLIFEPKNEYKTYLKKQIREYEKFKDNTHNCKA